MKLNPTIKILGSVWFVVDNIHCESCCSSVCVGIVLIHTGFEEKAYIGTGRGIAEQEDEKSIARQGTPFPLTIAKELIL